MISELFLVPGKPTGHQAEPRWLQPPSAFYWAVLQHGSLTGAGRLIPEYFKKAAIDPPLESVIANKH